MRNDFCAVYACGVSLHADNGEDFQGAPFVIKRLEYP